VVRLELELERFDLSLAHRRATDNEVVADAARAMRESGFGIKAATVTPEGKDDVGSPNRLLREQLDGKVIVRTGRRIPGITPLGGTYHPISVVRMAVEDAYGATEWREGTAGAPDERAYRTEHITRSTCRAVSEYAFRQARKMGGKVYGGPKWTVSPVYEGLLKDEMDAAAGRYPDAPHGTAPTLLGKDVANPMAMLLSAAAVLHYAAAAGFIGCERASRAIYESVLEATRRRRAHPRPRR